MRNSSEPYASGDAQLHIRGSGMSAAPNETAVAMSERLQIEMLVGIRDALQDIAATLKALQG
jgi:hypothetical protein